MPIPAFSLDGVLPPFLGPHGPGGHPADMSPYDATALEVIARFGSTTLRNTILRGWLAHRAELRAVGFLNGFQWLNGSFVEDKQPQDLDVVAFLYRPTGILNAASLLTLMNSNPDLFRRQNVRTKYQLDFIPVDLNGSAELIVQMSRYYMSLFSHRRDDQLWKGMIQVRLDDPIGDQAAEAALTANSTPSGGATI